MDQAKYIRLATAMLEALRNEGDETTTEDDVPQLSAAVYNALAMSEALSIE